MKISLKTLFLILPLFFVSCKKENKIAISTKNVTEVTSTTAVCGGYLNEFRGSFFIGVCYSNVDELPTRYDDSVTSMDLSVSYNCNITNLIPNTKYYIRAFVEDKPGEIYYGDLKEFTTLPE